MLDNVLLGRFLPGDSFVHKLDSRAKLLFIMAFFVVVFSASTLADYGILVAFLLVCVLMSRITLGYFFQGIKPMIWLILFTAFFQILFVQTGEVYTSLWIIKVTDEGLWQAFIVTLRFTIIIGMSTLLTLTTNPLGLSDAVESLLSPFRRFGLPVHEIALILSIAMRFVPTILNEASTIMNAQRSRGVDFNEGSLLKRIKTIIPILIPLFANAIRRADELANAMEARGYQGGDTRTKYRQLKWTFNDTSVFVVLVLLYVILYFT
ncbi:energy-coupling factor transporter transmembrane protein EcfT [Carnobacteriaceae bacterium zg-ZUI240]|nr:energy-coupling factor transporter transmembrane protein EcfT [Carnobacteriaceae bacterium zg-ZUI240]